jgi:hydroxymethylpyrimidine kinase/phosphomethylpyrimidine kinase
MSSRPPVVLTFAGSDPTGGAGLQADCLTLASMGCHPLSVVTALTVQDTHGVASAEAVDARRVRMQAEQLLADIEVAAFKLGLVGSAANVEAISAILSRHADIPVVLDPVLASGRGEPLASEEVIAALRDFLVPQSTVVTPNSLEARRLAGGASLKESAQRLVDRGAEYVLVTGTHEPGDEVTLGDKLKFDYEPQERMLSWVELRSTDIGPFAGMVFNVSHQRQREGERIIARSTPNTETRELTDVRTLGASLQFHNHLGDRQRLTYGLENYHDEFDTSKVSIDLPTGTHTRLTPGAPDGAYYSRIG